MVFGGKLINVEFGRSKLLFRLCPREEEGGVMLFVWSDENTLGWFLVHVGRTSTLDRREWWANGVAVESMGWCVVVVFGSQKRRIGGSLDRSTYEADARRACWRSPALGNDESQVINDSGALGMSFIWI